jgi:Telomeric repeat-binding factor 2.
MLDDSNAFLNNINPGNSVAGILVYDVPKGLTLSKIELHDSMFSGGVTVTLSK